MTSQTGRWRTGTGAAAWLLVLLLGLMAPAQAATITLACGAVGVELTLCREGAARWAARTGHRVEVVSTPNSASERLALYQQMLAAGSGDIDVFQIDIVWPGILAGHLVDLAPLLDKATVTAHLPQMIDAGTVDGRLVALPWFADVGLLYYRRDLLARHGRAVPTTWQELTQTAQAIQAAERQAGHDGIWGYVWQGRAYEGLTCNALEWIASFGGGTILDARGRITVNNPRAVAALGLASSWVGRISPPGVLNYAEEESRAVFQSGDAVFMRNWPYAWALALAPESPVRGRIGIAALPRGAPQGGHAGTLGGAALAISRYSDAGEAAVDLVRFLTGPAEQKRRALAGGFNPSRPALYDDPDLRAANPLLADLRDILREAVARPADVAGIRYNQVSSEFWNAVHATLSDQSTPARTLAQLTERLEWVSRGGRW